MKVNETVFSSRVYLAEWAMRMLHEGRSVRFVDNPEGFPVVASVKEFSVCGGGKVAEVRFVGYPTETISSPEGDALVAF